MLGISVLFPVAGFAQGSECNDCHADVFKQLRGNSHHIQGTGITGKHCHACHWEATTDGQINPEYHSGEPGKTGLTLVDLVVWSGGKRPATYKLNETAVLFSASEILTSQERAAAATITIHCLGCHSDQSNDILPFEGDNRTPRQYAWDGQSVASRYSNKNSAVWGKYSTATSNKKHRISKSFSAHGNASANQGGWSSSSGYDGDIPITRGNLEARNVECFDCHNSHGSTVSGITSSYRTHNGRYNGGILKETQSGKGGYRMTYTPSANLDTTSNNPYNAGAGICFDCHETATQGTTPWGYNSTFGAEQPVIGYKDTHRFGSGSKGSTTRYPNRKSRTEISSSHLKAGKLLNYTTNTQPIRGLCTPCHDPHGVSLTLGDSMPYALPLLKGAWLTSPYREDSMPSGQTGTIVNTSQGNGLENPNTRRNESFGGISNQNSTFFSKGSNTPRAAMQGIRYNVDRNTFGENRFITEAEGVFAGLCLKCHSRNALKESPITGPVHRTVKGWGDNKEHSFSCSKCHQPHSSGLPRLMQTNCFEQGPSGLRENSGLSWQPHNVNEKIQNNVSRLPSGNIPSKSRVVGCHVRQFGKSAPANTNRR